MVGPKVKAWFPRDRRLQRLALVEREPVADEPPESVAPFVDRALVEAEKGAGHRDALAGPQRQVHVEHAAVT